MNTVEAIGRPTDRSWSTSRVIGFLLGLPVAWPAPPLYVFAFLTFAFLLAKRPAVLVTGVTKKSVGIYLLVVLALISNIYGLSSKDLDTVRVITTSFFFLFLVFDELIENKLAFLEGFANAMMFWAVGIIAMALYLQIYQYGGLLFSVPEYRLWGQNFFPDWPNFLAFLLAVAFMLNLLLFSKPYSAMVILFAAMLTTSRTPFLAVGLSVLALCFYKGSFRPRWFMVVAGAVSIFMLVLLLLSFEFQKDLLDRLFIFEDRENIYSFALNLLWESPLLGHGAILLDESIGFDGFPSFHNSYLDVSVRHGLIALCVFLVVLFPSWRHIKTGGAAFVAIVVFFLAGAFVQNFLKHPHVILIYIIIASGSDLFDRRKYAK